MTAQEIASAYLGKEITDVRLAKAKALAERSRVPWSAVESAIKSTLVLVQTQLEQS